MRQSETIEKLAAALAAWALEAADPVRGSKGQVGQNRNYMYAALDDFLPGLREGLAKHGVVLIQSSAVVTSDGPWVKVTRLLHSSGQWVETDYPLSTNADPQKMGSADTYARRYGVLSALGLAPVDDDGSAAAKTTPNRNKEAPDEKQVRVDQHDEDFKKEAVRKKFMGDLKKFDIKYDEACELCDFAGLPRPSHMTNEQRAKFLKWLPSDAGKAKFAEYIESIDPEQPADRGAGAVDEEESNVEDQENA